VGGSFKSSLFILNHALLMNSLDLKDPPTAVGGIRIYFEIVCRKDLKDPPTAVGGI